MTRKSELLDNVRVGSAGWTLPKEFAGTFPGEGSHLERYARVFRAVEINSSFYRPHRPSTYARWSEAVPDDFRFAVKVPREVTHEHRLADVSDVLDRFLSEASHLGRKLGPLLVQLPPSLSYSSDVGERFFRELRARFEGEVVLEPRHESWFEAGAEELMQKFRVARAAADPSVVPAASVPGGWDGLVYYRLHGSPRVYYSEYAEDYLEALSERLSDRAGSATVWCIFDNTASGAATGNALFLLGRVEPSTQLRRR